MITHQQRFLRNVSIVTHRTKKSGLSFTSSQFVQQRASSLCLLNRLFVGVTMTTTEETRHSAYDAMWELCMYLSVIYSEKLRFLSYFYYRYGISITRNKSHISASPKCVYIVSVRARSSFTYLVS